MNARQLLVRSVSEEQLEKCVVDLAHVLGYMVAGFRAGRVNRYGCDTYETPVKHEGKGFPDLVLVRPQDHRPGRVLFIELKSSKGRLSREQELWIEALDRANAAVYVFRPADWSSGEIERALR